MRRQDALIEAYLELAHKGSVDSITLHQIAKKAKVAYGTVHYHFNDKDKSIADAAIEYVIQHGQQFVAQYLQIEAQKSKKLAIELWIEANFAWADRHPVLTSFMIFYFYRCSTRSRYREMNSIFLDTATQRIEGLIYEDVGRGRLPKLKALGDLPVAIHSLVIGSLLRTVSNPKLKSMKAASQQCESATRALIGVLKD